MPDEAIAVVAISMPFLTFAIYIVCNSVVRIVCHWRDVSLKMQLVERGVDAQTIEQIINAGRWEVGKRRPAAAARHASPAGKPGMVPPQRFAQTG